MLNFKIDDAAKYVALVSAGLYAAGFLIVNSNLARYGDFDPDFASSRYIFAGFLFVWFIMPFAFCVVQPLLGLKEINSQLDVLREHNRFYFYATKMHLYGINSINSICMCAVVFGVVTIDGVNLLNYKNYLGIFVLIALLILMKICKGMKPVTLVRINWFAQLISIVLFFAFADHALFPIFGEYTVAYFLFSFLIKPLRESFSSREARIDLLYYSVSAITLLVLFGQETYAHVKHQYGGGLPVKVTVYTKSDAGTPELAKAPSGGFSIDMIALNDKKLIGMSGGKLAIINADGIASVVYPDK